jgi:hypothetical protein
MNNNQNLQTQSPWNPVRLTLGGPVGQSAPMATMRQSEPPTSDRSSSIQASARGVSAQELPRN